MEDVRTPFVTVECSLADLLGREYTDAVCAARAWLTEEDEESLKKLARKKVPFFPRAFQQRLVSLLPKVGKACVSPLPSSRAGATSDAFKANTRLASAPLSGLGYYRLVEGGGLALTTKSEHYHASLGHGFPGYQLLGHARALGIPNATHNNTRGHITRTLEEKLIRVAAGLDRGGALDRVLGSDEPHVLNRVLNLETGSLATEAAVKMMLARFYTSQAVAGAPAPAYAGRTPVFLVLGDETGGVDANYHGTTVLTQLMRGMWGAFGARLAGAGAMRVRGVKPNDITGFGVVFREYDQPPFKIAGFLHEIIMMNYGAVLLHRDFLEEAYALCHAHDVPVLVDEIQSCVWSPEIFMYREYGLSPDCVAVGKGIPGGEYAASRVLFTASLDSLEQFGALVTNGQEEIASLACLVTLRWAEANAEVTNAVGEYYEERIRELSHTYSALVSAVEGRRHMTGLHFGEVGAAADFAKHLNARGLEVSVQTYKAGCPPAALMKLPLIAGYKVVDFVLARMEDVLRDMDTART